MNTRERPRSSEVLPITVPNPAHAQFISRESTDPREDTKPLSATRAWQLIGMSAGESLTDYRESTVETASHVLAISTHRCNLGTEHPLTPY